MFPGGTGVVCVLRIRCIPWGRGDMFLLVVKGGAISLFFADKFGVMHDVLQRVYRSDQGSYW